MILVHRLRGLLLLSTSVLAACGGGGGGGGASGPTGPINFDSIEYRASYGHASINAISAYRAGYSGKGVTVAVIDSGIDVDHRDLQAAIHPASIDMFGGSINDVGGHGTLVAGVIGARRNDAGMHGVAYDSRLMVVRTDTTSSPCCSYSTGAIATGTDYAVANGASVLNYSVGYDPGVALPATLRDALEQAVVNGAIVVAAAGNDGNADPVQPAAWAADPNARGQAIAVGAVDQNNQIAPFSNRAGAVQNQFLVAPGVNIYTTDNDGGYSAVSGTSFSAPHVSGAAAILKERFPNLTAQQIVEILLTSATDLGDPGTDAVYGRGLLNLDDALQPLGATTVPAGTTAGAGGDALGSTSLRVGAAFGDALAAHPTFDRVLFLDGYDRPYLADLSGTVSREAPRTDLADWIAGGRRTTTLDVGLGGTTLSMSFEEQRDTPLPDALEREPADDARFALTQSLGMGAQATVTSGHALGRSFGIATAPALSGADLLARDAFGSPYLGLVGDGSGVTLGGRLGGGFSYRLGAVSNEGRMAEDGEPGEPERTGYVAELAHAGRAGRFGVVAGALEEEGSVLGTTGSAAFAIDERVGTRFVGAFGAIPLGRFELFGSYTAGWTDASAVGGNLIGDMSALRSDALSIGIGTSGVLRAGDRVTFALTRPLKVTDGTATLDVPVGLRADGSIDRAAERVGLAPSGNELDAEASYVLDLDAGQQIRFNLMTRFAPDHVAGAAPEVIGGIRYKLRF